MLRAVLFDFDGIVVDSEPVHLIMFQRVLREEGIELTAAAYEEKYLAMDDRGCFRAVLTDHGQTWDEPRLQDLVARKARYFEAALDEGIPFYPGALEFIAAMAACVPIAVASGALRNEIERPLRAAAARDHFTAIVSAEDVTEGKPSPVPFQTALAAINQAGGTDIQPGETLVVEDSVHGVTAARRAGMKCVAVANSYPAKALEAAGAGLVVASLDGLEFATVAALFPD